MLLEAIPHADRGKDSASGGWVQTHLVGCCFVIFFFQVAFENKRGEVLPFRWFFGLVSFFSPCCYEKEKRKKKKGKGKNARVSVGEREENLQGKKVSVCTQEFGFPVPQECLATNFQQHYVQRVSLNSGKGLWAARAEEPGAAAVRQDSAAGMNE